MPQQTDPAVPMRLSTAVAQRTPRKVRVAGHLVDAYDGVSPVVQLTDGNHVLPVDISLCLDPFNNPPWLRERHASVMFIGHLEATQTHSEKSSVILRVLIASETTDLQMSLWDRAIQERERLENSDK